MSSLRRLHLGHTLRRDQPDRWHHCRPSRREIQHCPRARHRIRERPALLQKELGIDLLINTDALTAADIVRGFDYPYASSIEPFGNGRVTLVNIRVNHNAPIIGRTVASLRSEIPPDLLLCVIERNFQAVIPKGPTVIYEDDYVQLTGDRRAIDQFSRLCGHPTRNWRSALIVGASRISHYLVPALLDRGVRIKVIESNPPDRANRLAIAYPNIQVIQGDGTSQRFYVKRGSAITMSPSR